MIAAALVVLVAGMRAAAPILLPIAVAVFLAILSLPLQRWLRSKRVPSPLAVTIAVLANVLVLGAIALLATQTLSEFVVALPRYVSRFQELTQDTVARMELAGLIPAGWVASDLVSAGAVVDLAREALRRIAGLLTNSVLVLIILGFVLAEASSFPYKLRAVSGEADDDLARFSRITFEVQRYLGIKTLVSLTTGLLLGLWVWMLGVDFPLLWGLLAFILNYIPSVGSILAAIPPILLALVQFGFPRATVVAMGYLAVNVAIGNITEPNLMGRQLGLSPLIVVLSLIFWGWVFGPVGMFLSVPLTVIAKILLEHTNDFRWAAVLLGGAPATGSPRRTGEHAVRTSGDFPGRSSGESRIS
jgi:AI-2 transport protein TqsA